MAHRCSILALLVIASVAPAVRAQGDPKAALKALYEALEAADAPAVRNLFHAATPAERDLADAFAAQLTAARALGEAASKKYGATGDALSRGMPVKEQLAQLRSAQVTTEGDSAAVKLAGQEKPLRLTRVDGAWRINIGDYAGDDLPGQTAVMRDMTAVFNAVAADINADKLPTPQDAQRALQQKLQAVLFNTLTKHSPPATRRSATTQRGAAK